MAEFTQDRSADKAPDGSGVRARAGEIRAPDRSAEWRVYLKFTGIAALIVGTAATVQILYVFSYLHPAFYVIPGIVALSFGFLLGHVSVLRDRLRRKSRQFRAVADFAQEFTYFRTLEGVYEYISPSCVNITGYTVAEFQAVPSLMNSLVHPDDVSRWQHHVHHANSAGEAETVDLRIRHKDGRVMWISHICGPVFDETGKHLGVRSTNLDITQRKIYQDHIERMAYFDPLTDLPNRRSLSRHIRSLIGTSLAEGKRFALLFLDLDRFKHANDTYGHALGDRLLRTLAQRLSDNFGKTTVISRFGGDEFVIVVPDMEQTDEVIALARHVLEVIEQTIILDDKQLNISGSIGIALFPQDGTDGETLIRNADAAMYRSKVELHGKIRLYSPDLVSASAAFLSIESMLREAIRRDDFLVYYQPKVDLASGRVVGLEALVRWQHPEQGLVMPGGFIPVAEETGLIQLLGQQVLKKVCDQLLVWQRAGIAVPVAVNISSRQIANPDFCDIVEKIVRESGCDMSLIELEVTEQVFLNNMQEGVDKLTRLREGGMTTALDDFGTGYSSLTYIRNLPINTVKIDQSFTQQAPDSSRDAAILRTIVTLCNELDLGMVAEGIETVEQKAFLQALGCTVGQGYLFHRPQPADVIEPILVARGVAGNGAQH